MKIEDSLRAIWKERSSLKLRSDYGMFIELIRFHRFFRFTIQGLWHISEAFRYLHK